MKDPVLTARLTRTEWLSVIAALLSATAAKPPLEMVSIDAEDGPPVVLLQAYPLLKETVCDLMEQLESK